MWIVLCQSEDEPAIWAFKGLKARGLHPIELITIDMLEKDVTWEHRVGSQEAFVEITLKSGLKIRSTDVRGVLNRLLWIPLTSPADVRPEDREYAMMELYAFFVSWLHSLPNLVLNRPAPQGLSGRWRHASEWFWLASKARFQMSTYRLSSRDISDKADISSKLELPTNPEKTVIVVDGRVVSPSAPLEISKKCIRLSKLAGISLLGVYFSAGSAGPWTFAGATPFPDLRLGGTTFLDILATVFKGESETEK